jgi:type IV secretion system protein VirB10
MSSSAAEVSAQSPEPSAQIHKSPGEESSWPNGRSASHAGERHAEDVSETLAGERGASALHRSRSLQSRAGQVAAMGLMSALGLGLLGWYYLHTFSRQGEARHSAQTASRNQAAGDMPLPALGRIDPPPPAVQAILGPAPAEPPPAAEAVALVSGHDPSPPAGNPQPAPKSAAQLALERRLSGPAFSRNTDSGQELRGDASAGDTPRLASDAGTSVSSGIDRSAIGARTGLQELLKPSATPAARASVLPTQRLLLPKGAFIDCTLETAIDSTLPGMTTCVTATDTFSADGSTVLLERGTKLVGETRGEVQQGAARVFVLWSEARTPSGVVIPLSSPGTDELGRSGLAGNVNRHFFQRLGAAFLITLIDGAVQSAVNSRGNGGTVIYNPSTSQDVMTEVLKGTINIAPTVTKNQGDRIQVLVARDLDFRSVYELKLTSP